jgi:hypothetical protein
MRRQILVIALASGLSACTARPEDVAVKPADPALFASMNCPDLAIKQEGFARDYNDVSSRQDTNAKIDAGLVAGSVVILWPMLAGLAFTTDYHDQLARARGQYDAVLGAERTKQCLSLPPVDTEALGSAQGDCTITGDIGGNPMARSMTVHSNGAWCADHVRPPVVKVSNTSGDTGTPSTNFSKIVSIEVPLHGQIDTLRGTKPGGSFVVYQPKPGTSGVDNFTVVGFFDNGQTVLYKYRVNVSAP